MEKLVIKICTILENYLKLLYKKNKSKNIDIKILMVLDLYGRFYKFKKPLLLMFWYNSIQIHRISIKNNFPHGGCRLKKKTR